MKLPKVPISRGRRRRVFLLMMLFLALAAAYLTSFYLPTQQIYLSKMISLEQRLEKAGFVVIPGYLKKISRLAF